MSINVNMKKIGFVIVILLIVGVVGYNRYSTKDVRKAKVEYKMMVRFADKQAVEIAIIEQSSKLENYKQQLVQNQRVAREKISQAMKPLAPVISTPIISDSNDIE